MRFGGNKGRECGGIVPHAMCYAELGVEEELNCHVTTVSGARSQDGHMASLCGLLQMPKKNFL